VKKRVLIEVEKDLPRASRPSGLLA